MDLGLSGKVALIAASSKGLGKACALAFAREGARVVICARDKETLVQTENELRRQCNADVLSIPCDLTDGGSIKNLVRDVTGSFGTIDVLVNNAGGPSPGYFLDMQDDAWDQAYQLSLMSSVRLTREVLPFMKKQKYGRIVNITSVTVKQPIDQLVLSNSLRMGVIGWAKTLSNQVAGEGITINNVCPGWTRTGRVDALLRNQAGDQGISVEDAERKITDLIPMRRMGTPDEFAELVVFLASNSAAYITGTTIQIDGGLTAGYY